MALEVMTSNRPCEMVPNRTQNCQKFGEWEDKSNQSSTSKLCHGGVIGDKYWHPCQVREECERYTKYGPDGKIHLPGFSPRPSAPGEYTFRGSREIASTPAAQQATRYAAYQDRIANAPVNQVPSKTPWAPQPPPSGYWSPPGSPHTPPGVAPTYLPDPDESVLERLLCNIGNGFVAALGWQLWSYAQQVDIFGRR